MDFTKYDLTTGQLRGSGAMAEEGDIAANLADGEGVLLGVRGDWQTQRVNLATLELEAIPPVVLTLPELKAAAKARVANRRWEAETGGMPFGGVTLATDDRSKLLLSAAAARAQAEPNFTTEWKMQDGTWVTLNAAGLIGAYQAAFGWVADCFSREQEIDLLIEAAEDTAAVDALTPTINQFWP